MSSKCKESPDGLHEAGRIQYRCFGSDQGKTVWCKWCKKEVSEFQNDPSRFLGFEECIGHFIEKKDNEQD